MRVLPLAALGIGVIVIIWELPYVGSRTSLWPVLTLLALGLVLVAFGQIRHGG